MAEPINLNRARKERARAKARQQAKQNAAFHGLTKAKKAQARQEADRMRRLHESGRCPDDEPEAK